MKYVAFDNLTQQELGWFDSEEKAWACAQANAAHPTVVAVDETKLSQKEPDSPERKRWLDLAAAAWIAADEHRRNRAWGAMRAMVRVAENAEEAVSPYGGLLHAIFGVSYSFPENGDAIISRYGGRGDAAAAKQRVRAEVDAHTARMKAKREAGLKARREAAARARAAEQEERLSRCPEVGTVCEILGITKSRGLVRVKGTNGEDVYLRVFNLPQGARQVRVVEKRLGAWNHIRFSGIAEALP